MGWVEVFGWIYSRTIAHGYRYACTLALGPEENEKRNGFERSAKTWSRAARLVPAVRESRIDSLSCFELDLHHQLASNTTNPYND